LKRIKTIGLAVFTALALTAVLGAAGASAAELLTEKAPTTISSTGGEHRWEFHTAFQVCDAPQLEGSLSATHNSQLNATPKNAACHAQFTGPQMNMNGCTFVYRPGAQTGAATFNGTVDIACPGGNTISFDGGTPTCKVTVPAQNGLAATYENVGAGKERAVSVSVAASGVTHTQVSGQYCINSLGTFSDGTWTGTWTIKGSSGGGQAGIYVGTNPISVSQGAISAGTYPASLVGEQNAGGAHVLSFQGGEVKCGSVKFSSSLSSAKAQFAVQSENGGCTVLGFPGTVNMNGCTYTFNVLNQPPVGSTYGGHADIACPAGKAIEMVGSASGKVRCTVTIGAQTTDSEGLSFTNQWSSVVNVGLAIKGIDYHQQKGEGLGACSTGDFTTGTYTGSSTLVGGF
jgi:hypothetical protein